VIANALPTWKSAIQQVWKPALRTGVSGPQKFSVRPPP
jgi:hypothetical protein